MGWPCITPQWLTDLAYGRPGEPRFRWDVLLAVLVLSTVTLAGCGLQKLIQEGVDATVKVRPGGKNPDMQPPPVPSVPAPPPDDWAPPWFRRPKPTK